MPKELKYITNFLLKLRTAASPYIAATKSYLLGKKEQFDNLPEQKRNFVLSLAGMAVLGTSMYYVSTIRLLSQSSDSKKVSDRLRAAINAGKVIALFAYEGVPAEAMGHENYYGPFRGNIQYGSFWDTFSKEWEGCFRRLIGVQIEDSFLSSPRSILRGLVDGTFIIKGNDRIAFSESSNFSSGSELLESQSGHPYTRVKRDGPSEEEYTRQSGNHCSSGNSSVMYVDAGAHHLDRSRVRNSPATPFSMEKIFTDKTTVEEDKRYLKMKFADSTRQHFASNMQTPIAQQFDNLQQTMQAMNVQVQTSAYSFQDVPSTETIEASNDDIGI